MSNHPEIPMEELDNRQQEQREHEMWLDEREKEMVDNLEFHLKQMWKQFERDFNHVIGDDHEREKPVSEQK